MQICLTGYGLMMAHKSLVVFIQFDSFKICNMLSSFSNNFILNKGSLEILHVSDQQ